MKTQMIKAMVVLAAVATSSAYAQDPADVNLTKTSLNVDFNSMIDGNNVVKNGIQKNIDQSLADVDAEEASDKSRVLDFVDVELGFGEAPAQNIVDRRFNSIGEAQPVDLKMIAVKN